MIDSGEMVDIVIENVYEYCGKQREFFDLPPRCFECGLAQLQPSQIRYPNGHWPSEAITLFKNVTHKNTVEIEVRFVGIFPPIVHYTMNC